MSDATIAGIVNELRESRKYGDLSPAILERAARWAYERHAHGDAVKAAKRKLHQVYAAYCPPGAIARLTRLVDALPARDSPQLRDHCREILRGHASTAERLPHLETLYPALWEITGPPNSVLDVACGFHPFALPWMHLAADAEYVPCDIDSRLVTQINRFQQHLGRPMTARCSDALTALPTGPFDVAFVLKSLPCLEQQEPGCGALLLKSLPAKHVVASFPTASLGGRRKGMRRNYGTTIDELAGETGMAPSLIDMPGEVVAVWSNIGRKSNSC